jgi:NAD+ synthase (glutamine-hydrolysing)
MVSPEVAIADPLTNAERIADAAVEASAAGAQLVVFPELALSSYTAGDLLHTSTVREGSLVGLKRILERTRHLDSILAVGLPYEAPNGRLYNAAFVLQAGKVLGGIPKSYLPTYKEFYEERYLQSGRDLSLTVQDPLLGEFRFGTDQLFDFGGVTVAVEVCEDAWSPFPPVRRAAAAGAKIVLNLSASNETIGKAEFRRDMVADLSAQHDLIYVYVSANTGESTTDLVFGGHSIVASAGRVLAESERFSIGRQMTLADVDLDVGLHRLGNPNLFVRVEGKPLPARARTSSAVGDATVGAPVAVTTVPELGAALPSGDWREHGFARLALATGVEAATADAEVLVLDGEEVGSDASLAQLRAGRGATIVRNGDRICVVVGNRVHTIPVDVSSGEPPTRLRQFQVGALRFAVVNEASEKGDFPVSTWHALAGATTLVVFVDRLDARKKRYYEQQSARLNAAFFVVARPGPEGEANVLAIENGATLFAGRRARGDSEPARFDVDLGKLRHERVQNRTFGVSPGAGLEIDLVRVPSVGALNRLARRAPKTPFVPAESVELYRRSETILKQQAWALYRRVLASGTRRLSLGVSGGSDSTLSFLVYLEMCKLAGWNPAEHLAALTMPGFGSSGRTLRQSLALGEAVGIPVEVRDIRPMALQLLRDQRHPMWRAIESLPYRDGWRGVVRRVGVRVTGLSLSPEAYYPYVARFPELQDVSFENAQARARTTELMQEGFVIGTGDMSELALGWATYNADHMAMYNPNAGVPKTLVKHLIRWYANHRADPALKQVLRDILDTPVSPELRSPNADGTIAQVTEQFVGPYILTDFFLFHYVRYGFSARKIYELACATFAEGTPGVDVFERPEIKKWLRLFFERFFAQQYKRTVIPAGPKIGSVSLSSRGDWRMPDEASVRSELDGIEGWP